MGDREDGVDAKNNLLTLDNIMHVSFIFDQGNFSTALKK